MDKSADAFRTISEVAEHLETPAHVLRFWESRFPQIRPVKRAGGRRYYRPSDVALLSGIKRLLHDDGMTIRGVQKILREQGVRHVAGLLDHAGAMDQRDAFDGVADAADVSGADDVDVNETDYEQAVEAIDDAVVQLRPQSLVQDRASPGLAAAMAKAVDQAASGYAPLVAPDQPAAPVEPAQGALLLTPAPPPPLPAIAGAGAEDTAAGGTDKPVDQNGVDFAGDDLTYGFAAEETPVAVADTRAADVPADEDDDEFDEDLTPTLASRIRSLPAGASSAKVGAEFSAVVARLRALRDAMADRAHSGRG